MYSDMKKYRNFDLIHTIMFVWRQKNKNTLHDFDNSFHFKTRPLGSAQTSEERTVETNISINVQMHAEPTWWKINRLKDLTAFGLMVEMRTLQIFFLY